jgi:hypothetical protein
MKIEQVVICKADLEESNKLQDVKYFKGTS